MTPIMGDCYFLMSGLRRSEPIFDLIFYVMFNAEKHFVLEHLQPNGTRSPCAVVICSGRATKACNMISINQQ